MALCSSIIHVEEDEEEEATAVETTVNCNSKKSVRRSVEYVCCVLAIVGISVSAEQLRRAKFDDASATRPLLRALHQLLLHLISLHSSSNYYLNAASSSTFIRSSNGANKNNDSVNINKQRHQLKLQQRQHPPPPPTPPHTGNSDSDIRASNSSSTASNADYIPSPYASISRSAAPSPCHGHQLQQFATTSKDASLRLHLNGPLSSSVVVIGRGGSYSSTSSQPPSSPGPHTRTLHGPLPLSPFSVNSCRTTSMSQQQSSSGKGRRRRSSISSFTKFPSFTSTTAAQSQGSATAPSIMPIDNDHLMSIRDVSIDAHHLPSKMTKDGRKIKEVSRSKTFGRGGSSNSSPWRTSSSNSMPNNNAAADDYSSCRHGRWTEGNQSQLLQKDDDHADGDREAQKEMLEFVKVQLHRWGYPAHAPIFLATTMATPRSRPLLLALAWLLSSFDVLGCILRRRQIEPLLQNLQRAPLPPYPEDVSCTAPAMGEGTAAESEAREWVGKMVMAWRVVLQQQQHLNEHGDGDVISCRRGEAEYGGAQQALLLWGRVDMCARRLRTLRTCKAKLMRELQQHQLELKKKKKNSRLHSSSSEAVPPERPVGSPCREPQLQDMSPYQIFLLRHTEALRDHLRALQSLHVIRQIVADRRAHEALFHHWMQSVAAADATSTGQLQLQADDESGDVGQLLPPAPNPLSWTSGVAASGDLENMCITHGWNSNVDRFLEEWSRRAPCIRDALLSVVASRILQDEVDHEKKKKKEGHDSKGRVLADETRR